MFDNPKANDQDRKLKTEILIITVTSNVRQS